MKTFFKIGLSCFIGGVICTTMAILFTPNLWWFGIIAGFAAGYISFEFKEVFQAIPRAYALTKEITTCIFTELLDRVKAFYKNVWLIKYYPFLYPIILSITVWMVLFYLVKSVINTQALGNGEIMMLCLLAACYSMAYFTFSYFLGNGFIALGSTGEKKYFYHPDYNLHERQKCKEECETIGLTLAPLTPINVLRWYLKGIPIFIPLAFRDTLKFIKKFYKRSFIKFKNFFIFGGRFFMTFIKIIHSNKRLLCGIDAVIGGVASYTFLAKEYNTFFVILFGGLIGAAWGILNWELVSKRIFKVHINKVSI